jgi:hypothetical protein
MNTTKYSFKLLSKNNTSVIYCQSHVGPDIIYLEFITSLNFVALYEQYTLRLDTLSFM